MKHIKKFNEKIELLTEASHERFQYENVPGYVKAGISNPIINKRKDWIRNNPHLARRKPEESDFFEIEVFGYNHKQVADDLYNTLKDSGFLEKYTLFSIRIYTMQ